MWLLVFVALLFYAGQVYNLARGEYDPAKLVLGGSIGTLALAYFWFFRGQAKAEVLLRRELSSHAEELRAGGRAKARGQRVDRETTARTFGTTISFVIVSVRLESRPFLPGEEGAWLVRFACTSGSLLFGWWGLPWGPIWTLRSVVSNLRGGTRMALLELIDGPPSASPDSRPPPPPPRSPRRG